MKTEWWRAASRQDWEDYFQQSKRNHSTAGPWNCITEDRMALCSNCWWHSKYKRKTELCPCVFSNYLPGIALMRGILYNLAELKSVKNAAAAAKSYQSRPILCDPIDAGHEAPPSLGFSRQEHWSGLPLPSPQWRMRREKFETIRRRFFWGEKRTCNWKIL